MMTEDILPPPRGSEDRKTVDLCGSDYNGARCVLDKGHDGPCEALGTGVRWERRLALEVKI